MYILDNIGIRVCESDPAVRMLSVVRTGIYTHLLPKGLLVRPAPFSVRCWNSTVLELASLRKADPWPKIYLLNSEFANLSKGCNGKKTPKVSIFPIRGL